MPPVKNEMRAGKFISLILLLAISISLLGAGNVVSQPESVTTSTTISQPPIGQCTEIWFGFSGQAGNQITGTFGSDASISFYILSQPDFDSIQNPTCTISASSRPLYSEINTVGYGNNYRSLPLPANGIYYFVFILQNTGQSQLAGGYATVELSYPSSIILMGTALTSSTTTPTIPETEAVSVGQEASTALATFTTTTVTYSYTTVTETLSCFSDTQQATLTAGGHTWVLGPGYQCGPANPCLNGVCAGPISVQVVTGSQTPTTAVENPSYPYALLAVAAAIAVLAVTLFAVRRSRRRKPYAKIIPSESGALNVFDDRLYNYITSQSGTISLSTASRSFGVPTAEINESIKRLKRAGRIS